MNRSAIERHEARRPQPRKAAALHAEETRRRLLESAAAVFARDGFHGAKIAVITCAAGVANGTFYLHFASKEAIAGELARIATLDLAHRLGEVHVAMADPDDADLAEIEAMVDFVLTNRTLVVALLSGQELERIDLFELLSNQRESEIRAAQAAGSYTTTVDPTVAARAEVSMLSGVLRWWARTGFAVERRVVVDSLARLRRHGSTAVG